VADAADLFDASGHPIEAEEDRQKAARDHDRARREHHRADEEG
jgi:hypothetical protein